jgi:hypothetical protein
MAGLLAHEAKDLEGPLVMAGISLAHRLPFTPVQPFTQVQVQEKLFQVNLHLLCFFL